MDKIPEEGEVVIDIKFLKGLFGVHQAKLNPVI